MKIFDLLYPDAPKSQRKIINSLSKIHRNEWMEIDGLNQDAINELINRDRPLIKIHKTSQTIQLTDFGRTIAS